MKHYIKKKKKKLALHRMQCNDTNFFISNNFFFPNSLTALSRDNLTFGYIATWKKEVQGKGHCC